MAVRSTILTGPIQIAPTGIHTTGPPAGDTWIVRTLVLVNARAAAVPIEIGLGGIAEQHLIVTGLTVPANGRRVFEEWWVVRDNQLLSVRNGSSVHPMTYTLFGAQLVGEV